MTPIFAETDSGRLADALDSALLNRPDGLRKLTRAQFRNAFRLALLCSSKEELSIVAWRCYHQLKFEEIGARLRMPAARTRELFESLQRRSRAVDERRTLERQLQLASRDAVAHGG